MEKKHRVAHESGGKQRIGNGKKTRHPFDGRKLDARNV